MGTHRQHQRGSADTDGRASLASAGFGEGGGGGLAPGFYLRYTPVGAAPRITKFLLNYGGAGGRGGKSGRWGVGGVGGVGHALGFNQITKLRKTFH